jgi:hypothetical protein
VTSYSRPRNSAKSVNTELSSAEMGAAMRKSCDGSGAKLGAADPLKSARRVPEASDLRDFFGGFCARFGGGAVSPPHPIQIDPIARLAASSHFLYCSS